MNVWDESPSSSDAAGTTATASHRLPLNAMHVDTTSSSKPAARNSTVKDSPVYERRTAMCRVAQDASKAWISLPAHWRDDKRFILHALAKSPMLPPKGDFERQFSQALRFDKDVVLAFCARPDFIELFDNRHLFVPGTLCGDKEVMMAYCRQIPRSLQECSEALCDDSDVVEAALSLGGLELQYASSRLQQCEALVLQACQSNGRALEFCPLGPTRTELTSDREFMLNTVLSSPGGGSMWKLASREVQQDEEVLLQALLSGLLLRDIPNRFLTRLDFLQRAIQGNSSLYLQLPVSTQSQVQLARTAILAVDSNADVHARAILHCTHLMEEREVILAICQRGSMDFMTQLLTQASTTSTTRHESIFDDVEIMMAAISRDSNMFPLASRRLQEMPEIILVSITPASAWNTLKRVSSSMQRQHPEIPLKALQMCPSRNLLYLSTHIPEDLWTAHRPLCLAWLQRGGRVLEAFEESLKQDLELALSVAQHNWSEFHKVGDVLLANRSFMLQALEKEGQVLLFASSQLRQDFDMLVMAVAHYASGRSDEAQTISSSAAANLARLVDLPRFEEKVQEQLALHQTFCQDFLQGIAMTEGIVPSEIDATPEQGQQQQQQQPYQAPSQCHLSMLNGGVETSQALKKLIAEYLGVPVGTNLTLLRKAHRNLVNLPALHPSRMYTSTNTRSTTTPVSHRWRRWNDLGRHTQPDLEEDIMLNERGEYPFPVLIAPPALLPAQEQPLQQQVQNGVADRGRGLHINIGAGRRAMGAENNAAPGFYAQRLQQRIYRRIFRPANHGPPPDATDRHANQRPRQQQQQRPRLGRREYTHGADPLEPQQDFMDVFGAVEGVAAAAAAPPEQPPHFRRAQQLRRVARERANADRATFRRRDRANAYGEATRRREHARRDQQQQHQQQQQQAPPDYAPPLEPRQFQILNLRDDLQAQEQEASAGVAAVDPFGLGVVRPEEPMEDDIFEL